MSRQLGLGEKNAECAHLANLQLQGRTPLEQRDQNDSERMDFFYLEQPPQTSNSDF